MYTHSQYHLQSNPTPYIQASASTSTVRNPRSPLPDPLIQHIHQRTSSHPSDLHLARTRLSMESSLPQPPSETTTTALPPPLPQKQPGLLLRNTHNQLDSGSPSRSRPLPIPSTSSATRRPQGELRQEHPAVPLISHPPNAYQTLRSSATSRSANSRPLPAAPANGVLNYQAASGSPSVTAAPVNPNSFPSVRDRILALQQAESSPISNRRALPHSPTPPLDIRQLSKGWPRRRGTLPEPPSTACRADAGACNEAPPDFPVRSGLAFTTESGFGSLPAATIETGECDESPVVHSTLRVDGQVMPKPPSGNQPIDDISISSVEASSLPVESINSDSPRPRTDLAKVSTHVSLKSSAISERQAPLPESRPRQGGPRKMQYSKRVQPPGDECSSQGPPLQLSVKHHSDETTDNSHSLTFRMATMALKEGKPSHPDGSYSASESLDDLPPKPFRPPSPHAKLPATPQRAVASSDEEGSTDEEDILSCRSSIPKITFGECHNDSSEDESSEDLGGPSITISAPPTIAISSSESVSQIINQEEASANSRRSATGNRPVFRQGGLTCGGCGNGIAGRIVSAMGLRWHPGCFQCTVCGELLEHVSAYEHEGSPYCHLDYHENFAPKCFHCKTPIVDEQFITLDDPSLGKRTYHEQHFFCAECGDPFLGPSNTPNDDDVGFTVYRGYAYCEACHVRLRMPKCTKCGRSIRDGMQAVEALGGKWHQECFACAGCESPFSKPVFFQKGTKAFCEKCFGIIVKCEMD